MFHLLLQRARQAARQDHPGLGIGFHGMLFGLLVLALVFPMPGATSHRTTSATSAAATLQTNPVSDDALSAPATAPALVTASDSTPVYTVAGGDTLSTIAPRFGTTWQQLCAINALPDCNVIQVGQVLKLTASASVTAAAYRTPAPAASSAAAVAVRTVLAQVGKPYVWGGVGPNVFDCSGLAMFAYRAAGISLPHSTAAQSRMGTPVARNALRPGDLVFFYDGGHVGIYIGNDEVVHAPVPGDVVKVTRITYMPYYTARRLV